MFRNKSEVDKHVSVLLFKAKNEHERNLRCFHIAQLYYKSGDYESAQRYATMYLSVRDDSAAAHKLLGQAYEGLGQKEKAIDAYTKSLKLEPDQSDLILKMCELLCDKNVQFDPVLARHWADRASSIFPHSQPVFMLKEKLINSDSNIPSKDLEELLHAEMKAKPMDINVRIKLLKLYADSGRVELALKNAFEVESRQSHPNCFAWYQCINNICKAYNRDNYAKCGWEFYIQWLSALDRMCCLSITETTSRDASEAVDCVYSLDQALYHANQCSKRPDMLQEFLKHISAQLSYHIGVLLMKKEKKENTQWKETKRLVGPLFLLSSASQPQHDQSWTLSLKDSHQKLVQLWVHQANCRIVQGGHFLTCLVKENHSEKMFLDKVSHFVSSDWKRQVYEKAFSSVGDANSSTSHFMNGTEYTKVPLKLPHSNSLKPSSYVSSFETCYFGSLHHLTWLGLRSLKKTSILEIKLSSFHTTCFKTLQFTINNLNNISVETINRLDVDSFLYATVFSTALIIEDQKTNGFFYEGRPQILPADISSPLCSTEQAKWWSNLCSLVKGGNSPQMSCNESMSDLRFNLQRGLEVVRGEGLSPFLIVALARTFAARAAISNVTEESEGCHARSLHLWQLAYPMLERLVCNKPLISPHKANALFEYPLKEVTSHEAKILLEEAKFFIGCHYMNTHQYERAVEEFKSIKTAHSIFNLATVYQKWAEEQMNGVKGEEITSEIRCRHVVLASKARDYLLIVKSMIKNDPKHPLHTNVESKIFEVEDMLARIEPENGVSERDINGTTEGSGSFESNASPITEALNSNMLNMLASSNQRNKLRHTSTPRRIQEQKTNRFNMSELIDLMSVQQSTNQLKMQQLLEQIRLVLDKVESVACEQRSQRSLVESLNTRLNTFESEMKNNLTDIKKDMKRPDLSNMFDEDDYTDEMLQYQNYPQYYSAPQRVVQNSAAPGAVPFVNTQYFSPRIEPLCQGFYNQQGALPFSEGQQLPDFLRQPKVAQPLLHPLQPGIPPPLNLPSGVPGPSRLASSSSVIPSNVMITTTDTLPSGTALVQPALSVNIPPASHRMPSPGAPHNFQIPLPPQPRPTLTIEERVVEEETPPPTYDPLPDYKPIVPLPDEIEVHTGEENEEVLFEKRAKLYRYVDKMWKERGVGNLKILKNKTTGKVRILMRREQVHKICANHFLTVDMDLKPKTNAENSWLWFANDFADEKVQRENFCVKFKTSEESEEFKTVFEKAKEDLRAVRDIPTSDQATKPEEPTLITPSSLASKAPPISNIFSSPQSSVSILKPPTFVSESKSQESSSQVSSTQAPINLGGFTFSLAQPKLKAPEMPKPEKEATSHEPSPFAKFSFSVTTSSKDPASIFSAAVSQKKTEPPNPFANNLFFSSNVTKTSESTPQFSSSHSSALPEAKKDKGSDNKSVARSDEAPDSHESSTKEDDAYNFVPTATFDPVIPMPKLISVETGEENENVVFEDRGQLYRYDKETKQWKERGIGQMKILKNHETGSVRLLMRREHILKVCCNHQITKDLALKPASEKAFTWATKDYSEEEPTDQIFSLKFKTPEQALRFKEAFLKAQSELCSKPTESNAPLPSQVQQAPLSSVIKRTPGSWECSKCYVSNKAERSACEACNAPKTSYLREILQSSSNEKSKETPKGSNVSVPSAVKTSETSIEKSKIDSSKPQDKAGNSKPLSEILKPKSGSWECSVCYVRNDADIEVCAACGTVKPGCVVKETEDKSISKTTFTFGMPPPSGVFQSNSSVSLGDTTNAAQPITNTFPQFTFGSPALQIPVPASGPTDLFTSKESGTASFANNTFKFSPAKFTFGTSTITNKEPPAFGAFSNTSSTKTGFSFSTLPPPKQNENTDSTFGRREFQFSMPEPSSPPGNKSQNDESGYDPEEEEDHVQFQPVVPLPEKINVVTGEEDEDVLYSHRAKLYRFDSTSREWKERGLGDVKILQHKETKKIRFLMRREPVMKVCLNHLITNEISLRPKDDKSWIWYAVDYAEGTQSTEQFAIKFKNADIAQEFKNEFEKAKLMVTKSSSAVTPIDEPEKEPSKERPQESNASNSDSDVEVVSVQKAPPELVEKALSLQLPANYYCYLENPPCPGCVGCEADDKDELVEEKGSKSESKAPSTETVKTSEEKKTNSFTQNLFGPIPSAQQTTMTSTIFGGSSVAQKSAGFTFAQAFSDTSNEVPKTTGFLFGGQASFSSPNPQKNIFTSVTSSPGQFLSEPSIGSGKDTPSFGFASNGNSATSSTPGTATKLPFEVSNDAPTFGSLAGTQGDQGSGGFGFGNLPSFSSIEQSGTFSSIAKAPENFKWDGAGEKVFSAVSTKSSDTAKISKDKISNEKGEEDNEEDEDDAEEDKDENDPYFEPVIPLPEKIELKTGEEDEDVVFCERGKLYRFSPETKEWKERGVGNMKILKNKTKNVFRLLMRREQVHKIVCNHFIKEDFDLKQKTDNAFNWAALNFCEGAQNYEQLCLKFKTAELAQKFKAAIDDCIQKIKEGDNVTSA